MHIRGIGGGSHGADEHARERIRKCVTERAQKATPASAPQAPGRL